MSVNKYAEFDINSPRPIWQDLATATSVGDIEWVREILNLSDSKTILNACNKGGWTSLMYAAYYGHEDILEVLLENGACVNARNTKRQTSLMLSAMCGHEKCSSRLLQYRARVDDRDEQSWTALVYAISSGYLPVVNLLIKNGANVNVVMVDNRITPIFFAASSGHEPIAKLLVEAGANLNIKTANNQTLGMIAKENGHIHLANLFETNFISRAADFKPENLIFHDKLTVSQNIKPSVSPYPINLTELLESLGLQQYTSLFEKNNIDLNSFLKLKEENLKVMGITKLGPRRKMASAITRINESFILPNAMVTHPTNACSKNQMEKQLIMENNLLATAQETLKLDVQLLSVLHPLISVQQKNIQLKDNIGSLKNKIGSKENKKGLVLINDISGDLIETERLNNEIHIELNSILKYLDKIAELKSFK